MVKFKRRYDPEYNGSPYQNESGVSMTQPSMSLTVRELMTRHTRGLETGIPPKEEIYLDESQEVPSHNDLVDIVEERERLNERKRELEKQLQDERAERKRQKEELERQRVAQKDSSPTPEEGTGL